MISFRFILILLIFLPTIFCYEALVNSYSFDVQGHKNSFYVPHYNNSLTNFTVVAYYTSNDINSFYLGVCLSDVDTYGCNSYVPPSCSTRLETCYAKGNSYAYFTWSYSNIFNQSPIFNIDCYAGGLGSCTGTLYFYMIENVVSQTICQEVIVFTSTPNSCKR